ncbi:unnamed protein product [Caenorhabditis sp. 36 PRJEB53466]|nr:unnamed protein product [Caenorhabditis sp. 36 PRJEB53466]
MTSPPSTSASALNVGILGHVDSGKTTLTRRIAEMGSTSAFDAHASTSKDLRRNTLDLGFSTMTCSGRRLALIDCPGHSGLIRAVLAASTVFDMAIVIIDAMAGIQPQTAEHLLLASLFCPEKVIIVMNKCDLANEKHAKLDDVKRKVRRGLKSMEMLENLKKAIGSKLFEPQRDFQEALLIALDHCFAAKGKGTVLTGTVIRGILRLDQELEFPALQERRRIKTLESWKQQVDQVSAGERAAFLVASFDEHRFSRCLIGAPGALRSVRTVLASVQPVLFFRSQVSSRSKLHISVAFETVMAECQFLREVPGTEELEQLSHLETESTCLVLLTFEKSIFVPDDFRIPFVASRLEQQAGKGCRFAFSGNFRRIFAENEEKDIKRFSRKVRKGYVERIEKDGYSAICTGMFKAETNFDIFRNFQIVTSSGMRGKIEGAFGKSGKFREMLFVCSRRCLSTTSRLLKEVKKTASAKTRTPTASEVGEDGLPKDYKLKTLKAGSRRLDTFINRATGQSSSEVIKLIGQGKVRVNDEVYTKKAYNVCHDDVIEVWKSPFAENSALANVERTEIVTYEVTEQGYNIEIKSDETIRVNLRKDNLEKLEVSSHPLHILNYKFKFEGN